MLKLELEIYEILDVTYINITLNGSQWAKNENLNMPLHKFTG